MKAGEEERTEGHCKNTVKGIKSGNGKEACNTLKVLTKTDKQKSAVVEDSARKILTECKAVRNRWTESCSVFTTTNFSRRWPILESLDRHTRG